MERLFAFTALLASMFILSFVIPHTFVTSDAAATLSFGFLILSAYLLAGGLKRFELPKITGYIIAGMIFGPSVLGFLSDDVLADLKLVDDLALAFIAFAAGGELRIGALSERKLNIAMLVLFSVVMVFLGVVLSVFLAHSVFPPTRGEPFVKVLAIASVLGVVAVARSPSSAIAIISETKSRGPFTNSVLGVTVVADVLTIFGFAIVLSFLEAVTVKDGGLNFTFFAGVGAEVSVSVIIGLLLGRGIIFYLERIKTERVIFILGTAFLVTKASHGFATILDNEFDIRFHLEPMLICLTAGFVVQNRSRVGDTFLRAIERSSLPIYAVFFAISGAMLDLGTLKGTWHFAIGLVLIRGLLLWVSTYVGGRLSSDPARNNRAFGFSFITQAGVSLGLANAVCDRFGDLGRELSTLIIASIAINQIIGPVAMKQALTYVGETKVARIAAITSRAPKKN